MNISVGSIKARRSTSQRMQLASLRLHLYSAEAFISCTYHKAAIPANIAAASNRSCHQLSISLSLCSPLESWLLKGFTPYIKLLSFDTCKGCWDCSSGGLCACFVCHWQWLYNKDWWAAAAGVSCFGAETCNENWRLKMNRCYSLNLSSMGFCINPGWHDEHVFCWLCIEDVCVLITKGNQCSCCLWYKSGYFIISLYSLCFRDVSCVFWGESVSQLEVKTVYIIVDERGAPGGLSNGLGGLWLLIMASVLAYVFVKEAHLW